MKKTKTIDEKVVDAILKVLKTECANDPYEGLTSVSNAFMKILYVTGLALGKDGREFCITILSQMLEKCKAFK